MLKTTKTKMVLTGTNVHEDVALVLAGINDDVNVL